MDDNPLGGQPNPRGFDVGAQPQQATQAQAAPQQAPQQAAPPPAAAMANQLQQADTQHHSMLGKAFRSIMGNDTSYQIDPQTGKTVQTDVPQKPGQFFRGIMAAAILGGATAAKGKAPGFLQGAVEGGQGVADKSEQEDDKKRQQAQDQFKNQMSARAANTEDDLKKTQIAMHNAQTLYENTLTQRMDYDFHKDVAAGGEKDLKPFIDANPDLVKFKDISEADMDNLMKNNPDAQHLMWRPTGTKIVMDASGKPNVHLTYSGVDPDGDVKLTDSQIKRWKDAGVDTYLGKNTWDVLTDGKKLSAKQYMTVSQKAMELGNQNLTDKKNKLDSDKEEAQIRASDALAKYHLAEAGRIRKEGGEKAKSQQTYLQAADALDKLHKEGKDFEDLPTKFQDALGDHSMAEAKAKEDVLKAMLASGQGDTPEGKKLYHEWESLTSVHSKTQASIEKRKTDDAGAKINTVLGVIKNLPIDQQQQQISGSTSLSSEEKETAMKRLRETNPDAKSSEDVDKASVVKGVENLVVGKKVSMKKEDLPEPESISIGQAVYTNSKGEYVLRDSDLKNPEWKKVFDGKLVESAQ